MLEAFIDTVRAEVCVDWASRLRKELTNRGIKDPIEWDAMVQYVEELIGAAFRTHAAAQTKRALAE